MPLSEISDQEISADLPGKERQGKKRQNGAKKKENRKRGGGKLKMECGKSYKMRRGPFSFSFFFFFFFFCFSFLKITEICFGCTKMGIF